jgi:hypothetical protein
METFELLPAYNRAILKRLLARIAPLVAVSFAVALYIVPHNSPDISPIAVLWSLPLLLAPAGFALARPYRDARDSMKGFRLTLGEDFVARELGGRDTRIDRCDISTVVETRRWGLTVKSARGAIFIPRELDRYPQVKETLGAWMPITTQTGSLTGTLAPLALVGLMIPAFTADNQIVALVASTALLGTLIYFAIAIYRGNSLDKFPPMARFGGAMFMLALLYRIVLSAIAIAGAH